MFPFMLCWMLTDAVSQTVSYMLPDIGSPGMNSMVEIIAPHDATGAFGADGLYLNNAGDDVRVVCSDPNDTMRITIGPFVVSWNGRMVSTQIFVHPDQRPPSDDWRVVGPQYEIPIRIVVNGVPSNEETFYIVRTQPAIVSTVNGTLGSGGVWGIRSKRGAMIVDSLILTGLQYDVSTADTDLDTPGNQGFLPMILLSRGSIRTGAQTIIHVNANGKHAGPGGGGGGGNFCDWAGSGTDGGDGFTGGGPGGYNRAGRPFVSDEFRNPGRGTGPNIGNTGGSLNALPGGTSPAYEASGGGTGHPFGLSGEGCAGGSTCNPPGGYGGGSGQQQTRNGGAGGYATLGHSSHSGNGGRIHGNDMLVPLAGGSGGASGNPQLAFACSGDGGGGGGALRLSARDMSAYLFTSYGGPGATGSSANGGAGSGGAISLECKLPSSVWKITALGGSGSGGNGGAGRIRMDGQIGWQSPDPATEESMFVGPSTDTTSFVSRSFTLTGTGNGETVRLFLKSNGMPWTEIGEVSNYGAQWDFQINLPPVDGVYFLAASQEIPVQAVTEYTARPVAVFSQSAANIFIHESAPHIVADNSRDLGELRCEDVLYDTMLVHNIGDGTLLIPFADIIPGGRGFELLEPTVFPVQIPSGESLPFIVRYQRIPGRRGVQRDSLVIYSNDNADFRNPWTVEYVLLVQEASLTANMQDVVFPDVVLCERSAEQAELILLNDGSIPLNIGVPQFSDATVSLILPRESDFPLIIPAGETLPVTLQITHLDVGESSGTVVFRADADGCDAEFAVSWYGRAADISPSLDPVAEFPTLRCFGESTESVIYLRNTGDADAIVMEIETDDAAFSILNPAYPIPLPKASSIPVTIQFAPEQIGTALSFVRVLVQPCNIQLLQPLVGRRDSVATIRASLDFGIEHVSVFPLERTVSLENTGSVPLTILSGTVASPYEFLSPLPLTIPPGESRDVLIRFTDPGVDGSFMKQIVLDVEPYCDSSWIELNGVRGEASVELAADIISASAGELVELRIFLRNVRTPQIFGATSINTTLRYNASLLVPLFENSGTLEGGERIIPLSVPLLTDTDGVAVELPFIATLGLEESTTLVLEQSIPVGGELSITEIPGRFDMENLCHEGGTRLFDASLRAGIHRNRPNPFNPSTVIDFAVIEEGRAELYVHDVLGRRVATLYDEWLLPGTYSAEFHAGSLTTGIYIAVLVTSSHLYSRMLILKK